jgi:hypothetical protein
MNAAVHDQPPGLGTTKVWLTQLWQGHTTRLCAAANETALSVLCTHSYYCCQQQVAALNQQVLHAAVLTNVALVACACYVPAVAECCILQLIGVAQGPCACTAPCLVDHDQHVTRHVSCTKRGLGRINFQFTCTVLSTVHVQNTTCSIHHTAEGRHANVGASTYLWQAGRHIPAAGNQRLRW